MEDLAIKKFLKTNITYGDGSGSGVGAGFSPGFGYGFGYGSGYGSGISSLNNKKVYYIDKIPSIIKSIHNNIAKCEIVNIDLSTTECYVAKVGGYFAHGETIEKAIEDASAKMLQNLPIEERIQEFVKVFKKDKKYKGVEFFEWHNKLTGSCLMGREQFVKNGGYDLNAKYSVKEFIEICENDFGSKIIKQLKGYYERN